MSEGVTVVEVGHRTTPHPPWTSKTVRLSPTDVEILFNGESQEVMRSRGDQPLFQVLRRRCFIFLKIINFNFYFEDSIRTVFSRVQKFEELFFKTTKEIKGTHVSPTYVNPPCILQSYVRTLHFFYVVLLTQ